MVKIRRQKVHPHKKKREPRPVGKRGLKGVFKFILWTVLVLGIGCGIVAFQYYFVDSDCFNIRGLDVRCYDEKNIMRRAAFTDPQDKEVLGANIFLVDLNDLKSKIEKAHPEWKDIVVRRALPNRLVVEARKRTAVAMVYAERPYLIDREGVILSYSKSDLSEEEKVPVISGARAGVLTNGRLNLDTLPAERITKALSLIDTLSQNKRLSGYKIKTVDVTDHRNVSFFLDSSGAERVEIKIGEGEFNKRLDTLGTVLEQLGRDIERVKYIDLRFEDPIVGPR